MICPNCGMETEDGEKVCPLCGFIFDENTAEESESSSEITVSEEEISSKESEKPKKSKGVIIIVILLVIVIALGAAVAVKFLGGSNNDNVSTVQSVTESQEETTEAITTTTAVPETTVTTTVTTVQTTTKATTTAAQTTTEPEKPTEPANVISDEETFSTYDGGIENPRIYAFVRQKGNEFNIRIRWSSTAFEYVGFAGSGTIDGGGYCNTNMTEYLVERDGESVNCEIYGNSDYDLRFYPENNMIVWDDIVLTKDSYETEFIIGTVNITDGVLNVRDGNGEIIGTLDKGEVVTVLEDLGDLYVIMYHGQIGTVASEFLKIN